MSPIRAGSAKVAASVASSFWPFERVISLSMMAAIAPSPVTFVAVPNESIAM